MRKYSFICVLLCLLSSSAILNAQSILRKANKQFELHAYSQAIKSYLKHLENKPNDREAIARIADSYRHLNQLSASLEWYEKAVESKVMDPTVLFHYAQSLKASGNYAKAKEWFLNYAEGNPVFGNHFAESCDFAQFRVDLPSLYEVVLSNISTVSSEFGPAFFNDNMIFSSSRKDMERALERKSENWEGKAFNQLFISNLGGGKAGIPKYLLNDLENNYNIGPLSYSSNGKWVAYTKNNYLEGTRQIPTGGMQMSLYIAEVNPDGTWKNAKAFPYNNESYSNGHPSFSADGQILYYASDRPDGFGGYDIFKSEKNGTTWSAPENLGPVVNSQGNEFTPFFDGKSIFFSSDWHPGFGGFDVFRAERSNNNWNKVYHLGSKVNSGRDDYGFIYSNTANLGFVTSNRPGGKGLEDIYQLRKITDNVIIKVVDGANNDPVPGAAIDFSACGERVFSTNNTGQYSFQALPGLNCKATVRKDGYDENSFELVTKGGGAQVRTIEVKLLKKAMDIASTTNAFSGRVVNYQSENLEANVLVRATNQLTGNQYEATTNGQGEFLLPLKTNSTYILRFSKVGFRDINKTVSTGEETKTDLGEIPILTSLTAVPESNPKDALPPSSNETANTEAKGSFAVQIAAVFGNQELDLAGYKQELESLGTIYKTKVDDATKIRIGSFETRDEARKVLEQIQAKGYPGAFLVVDKQAQLSNTPNGSKSTNADLGTTSDKEEPNNADNPVTDKVVENTPTKPAIISPYKVRLGSFRSLKYFDESKLEGIGELEKYSWNGYHIMVLSGFPSKNAAEKALEKLRNTGFKDAVLVKKEGGRLKSIRE